MGLQHQTLTAEPDDPSKDVSSSEWNEDHKFTDANIGALLVRGASSDLVAGVSSVATGQVLVSQGAGSLPAWSATPTLTSLTVTDDAYGAGWNGSSAVPTKNALYDKIETLGGGGGTPGGSDTQVQFNDGGVFGGDAGFVYNKTTDTLTLAAAGVLAWSTDLNVIRVAADTIAVRRSTNAQELQIGPSAGYMKLLKGPAASYGQLVMTDASEWQLGTNNVVNWKITTAGHLIANGAYNIGDGIGSSPVNIYFENYLEGSEVSDPAAPAANSGRLYFKDSGAGKTQLAVRFATGAVQILATEP